MDGMKRLAGAIRFLFVTLFLIFFLAGCASPGRMGVVQTGDVAGIHFLCRLHTGEVAAATDKDVGQQQAFTKSSVFLLREKEGPISVNAAPSLPEPAAGDRSFEEEITNRLAPLLVGMKIGESRTVSLTAEELPERGKDDYVLRMARVRQRAKEMKMSIGDYRVRARREPEVGQSFVTDPAVPGKVDAVTQDDVMVRFSAKPGDIVQTPFGPGVIRETEKNYEIAIDARKGALVRMGRLVGRITDVDEKTITADFRNPFGGETLNCDVTVEKIRHETTENAEKHDDEQTIKSTTEAQRHRGSRDN